MPADQSRSLLQSLILLRQGVAPFEWCAHHLREGHVPCKWWTRLLQQPDYGAAAGALGALFAHVEPQVLLSAACGDAWPDVVDSIVNQLCTPGSLVCGLDALRMIASESSKLNLVLDRKADIVNAVRVEVQHMQSEGTSSIGTALYACHHVGFGFG